jgi:hypothetical protein
MTQPVAPDRGHRSFAGPWVVAVVGVAALVVGIVLGSTVVHDVFDSDLSDEPESCVQAIERAQAAIQNGEAIVNDSEAALDAIQEIHLGDAATLLRQVADSSVEFLDQVEDFNRLREQCAEDRAG